MEIEDQPWCPSWLREYSHAALAQMWQTTGAMRTSSTAAQACDVLLENLPDPSTFTFVDACAGAGGPTPILEKVVNQKLQAQGKGPVQFILTDLYPDLQAWEKIIKRSENISFVRQPVDATKKISRYAEPGKKECRIFNLCFHHFNDEPAAKVLRSAVQTSDAFVIFEMTHRNLSALLNTTIVILSPLLTTLLWYWYSPMHILLTYIIPIVPIFFAVDGYVSCIRTRTADETMELLTKQKDLDLSQWEFKSGSQLVLPPFGNLYYYIGVKKQR
ncbi:hypothetical protein ACMFMF_009866 [Clarireedia jacksonii]